MRRGRTPLIPSIVIAAGLASFAVAASSTAFGDQTGRLDAFLTASDCVKLFDGVYAGSAAAPLCKIYIGPIAPGTVSSPQTLTQGTYSIFEQGWTSNDSTAKFLIDFDIWSDSCAGSPVARRSANHHAR